MLNPGDVVPIDILLFDETAGIGGQSPEISIERVSTSEFLQDDDVTWSSTYNTRPMTERTGNDHVEFTYRYLFTVPLDAGGGEFFDWSVKIAVAGNTYFKKGRLYVSTAGAGFTTERIRVFLFDNTQTYPAESPVISIERVSDGLFWDGASWVAAYTTLAMDNLFVDLGANDHWNGVYEYAFTIPNAAEMYDWSVESPVAGFQQYHKGRICAVIV